MTAHWTEGIDDAALRAVAGADTVARGATYAREGRVQRVSGTGGGALLGEVRGNGRQPYATLVTPSTPRAGAAGRGGRRWSGSCSCPVGSDCKHAVAVLIAARAGLRGPAVPPPAEPDGGWEARIGQLVRAAPVVAEDEPTGAPLALQLELVVPPPVPARGYQAARADPGTPTGGRRVLLRPLIRDARGAWVRAGASWRELEHGFAAYGRPVPDTAQREAMLELYAVNLARSRGRYPAGDRPLHLDDLGQSAWRLLRAVVAAGVLLVTDRPTDAAGSSGTAAVELAALPATVSVDLSREPRRGRGGAGDATLQTVVAAAGQSWPADQVDLVGSPAHGVVVQRPDGLLLAELDAVAGPQLMGLLQEGRRVDIPAADLPRFLREYYPGLRQVAPVTSLDGSVHLPEISEPLLRLAVTHGPGAGTALEWGFAYPVGEDLVRVPLHGGGPAVRDPEAERLLLGDLDLPPELQGVLTAEVAGTRHLLPRASLTGLDTVRFVEEVLPELLERDDLVVDVTGSPARYRYSDAAPVIELRATESTDRDWFDLGVTVSVDGEDIPFHPLFVALANGETHLVLDSGTWFSIDRPELEQLRVLIDEARGLQDRPVDELRLSAYQADLWEELSRLGVVQEQSERWSKAVRGLLDITEIPEVDVPPGLRAQLRPYQVDGFRWLTFLAEHELGGILADDMGLGKTLQALAMVVRAAETDEAAQRDGAAPAPPFLVVAPTSVVPNWLHEAERFAPGLVVRGVSQTSAKSGVPLAEVAAGAHVVVTSYALFRLDNESYDALGWSGLLLDEAQFVKNRQGRTHLCARRLRAPFKVAITGTPLENNLMELWSLLSIVAPGLYPDPKGFAAQYATPIAAGDLDQLDRLRRRVRPLMRRRTKEQVATELPPKVEQVLEVTLNPRHRRIYQTHLQRERAKVLHLIDEPDRNRFAILRSITLLRRLALDPALVDEAYTGVAASKVDVLSQRLEEVIGEGHRALVFSQFTGFLRTVRDRLDADGISYSYLDGRTRDRARRLEAFRSGDDPVFLISLKAGGVGLNLTEADYCFILDPWWNPAVEAQAVDRTHRIGQDKTVMVYRLVATETIEEKVMQLKERKLALFSSVMDDGALGASLTGEDIAGLLED